MPTNPTISEVVVEGLHDQFDFEIKLLPGLNILYGKNGRGKTTLLHLLTNLIELDFQRFSYLQFHKIAVKTSSNDLLELIKEAGQPPRVLLNGNATSFTGTNGTLSDVEAASLREALGPKPTYLPAFRSILERTRADSYLRSTERRDSEYEEILGREVQSLKSYAQDISTLRPAAYVMRQLQEEASVVAEKTLLCRQWFGRFVPVIRYPSVADVEDSLSEEWRRAALEISSREQRMFEETFVKIFRVISGLEKTPTTESNENLLESISALLTDQDSQIGNNESRAVFDRLLQTAHTLPTNVPLRGIDNSLLGLYRQLLEERNSERRNAFQKSRDFESSINRFLDSKTLIIGSPQGHSRSRSVVAVATSGGHTYGLSALSSGERQILTMLYSASRMRFQSGIFLIDEPELSLHIDWQRIILRELQNQSSERQIIACTHSPEVGADHVIEIQDFEPRNTRKRQESLFTEEDL